eukprot:m.243687 g.243687  ORF g.243687 m.243687 type:complete len:69 (+) comp40238_c0_seq79:913-1119(+)
MSQHSFCQYDMTNETSINFDSKEIFGEDNTSQDRAIYDQLCTIVPICYIEYPNLNQKVLYVMAYVILQ